MDEDKDIKNIQDIYEKFDRAHKFESNILPFPESLTVRGMSILDDVEFLLKHYKHQEMIEDRFLAFLQLTASDLLKHERL